jgi:hypothetical protein
MNQSQSPVIACEPLDDVIDRLRAADKIREQLERDARRAKALGIPLNPKLPRNFDESVSCLQGREASMGL